MLPVGPASRESKEVQTLSATSTAEPVQECLNFWMDEPDIPCTVRFAPHNQVFQQLLDPGSLLYTNPRGMNVVQIRLEEWWHGAVAPNNHRQDKLIRQHEMLRAIIFPMGGQQILKEEPCYRMKCGRFSGPERQI